MSDYVKNKGRNRKKIMHRLSKAAGISNNVLVLPTVVCANQVASGISQQVTGTTWIQHQHGCTQLAESLSQVLGLSLVSLYAGGCK